MLSVSNRYLQAINADSRRILHRVTLGKSVVLDQTSVPKITLDENIGGNSGVSLGTANSASLKLTLRDPAVIDYTDMLVEPEGGVELPDGTIEWLPLGKFYVTDSSTSNDYRTVELTCADGMYLMSGEYVSNLTYPALVRDVAREIANQAGVEFDEPSVWPSIYIRKKPEKQTLRNAIGYVAGCCGKNARFNRYGRLEFVWYKDTGLTIERTQQYLDGFTRLNDQSLNVNFNVTGETEKYKVTVVSDDNGNVIANPGTNVLEGDTVTLSVVPLYQYELSSISAVSASGASITLWQNAEGNEYTFTQPDSDVTVNVTFKVQAGVSPDEGGTDDESGALVGVYACPDTYSNPLPAEKWMLTDHAQVYKTDTDGSFTRLFNGTGTYAIYFDSFTVENIGRHFPNVEYDFFKITFPRLTIVPYQLGGGFYSSAVRDINEQCYILIADPTYFNGYGTSTSGLTENTCGLIATNFSINQNGLRFNRNSSIVCDCASSASVAKFAMRRSAGATVTMDYTNPLITAKMTDSISAVVEGVSYTPSKVKHRGNPALEVGDIVTVPDKDGNYHTVLIMQQTMVFGGGMNATITCPGQTEKKSNFSATGALTTQIQKVVREESYYQKKESDTYNSTVVSALSRSMSSMSRQVTENGAQIELLNEWRGATSLALTELSARVSENEAAIELSAKWQSQTAQTINALTGTLVSQAQSIANVQAIADANAATIASKAVWEQNVNTKLSNLETITSIHTQSIASVEQRATNLESQVEIYAGWEETINDLDGKVASHTQSIASISAKANKNEASITSQARLISANATSIASVDQRVTANSAEISLKASLDDVTGSFVIGAINSESYAKISADRLDIVGKTLDIKVAATNITGKLIADQIEVGALTAESIACDKITAGTNNNALTFNNITAQGGFVGGWNITSRALTNGATAGNYCGVTISGRGVLHNGIQQGFIRLYCGASQSLVSTANTYYSYDGLGPFYVTSTGFMYTSNACIGGKLTIGKNANYYIDGSFNPDQNVGSTYINLPAFSATSDSFDFADGTVNFGTRASVSITTTQAKLDGSWYGTSGTAISSARVLKENISALDDRHARLFDNLIPRSFTYKDGKSGRTHYGLVLDELKNALEIAGLTTDECAAYCLVNPDEPDGEGGIRYEELIALCIKEIQKLKSKLEEGNGEE